jgi:uncharacterized membrane protein
MAEKTNGRAIRKINKRTLMLVQLALLVAIMLVLNFTGFANFAIGPVNMTIMWVPIIIGAITLGPIAGAVLGGVFGVTVLINMGALTQIFLGMNVPLTIIFTVIIRGLGVGFLSGILFRLFSKADKQRVWSFEATALLTSLLNTFVFVAGTALFFGANEGLYAWGPLAEIESASRGAVFTTVFALVGAQAIIEAVFCTVVVTIVAKAIMTYLQKSK